MSAAATFPLVENPPLKNKKTIKQMGTHSSIETVQGNNRENSNKKTISS